MYNVTTLLRSDYKNKDGESQVFLRLYIKGKKIVLPIGVSVNEDLWDDTNKLVRSKHSKAADYNLIIEQARAQVNDILIKYRLSSRELTPHLLKQNLIIHPGTWSLPNGCVRRSGIIYLWSPIKIRIRRNNYFQNKNCMSSKQFAYFT